MSNLAYVHDETPSPAPKLGPAQVQQVEAHRVRLQLPSGEAVWAQLALAFCYDPQVDDTVLAIGDAEGHYVIGILKGSGTARMTFPGDVELRSAEGVVRIAGGKGVEVEAPEFSLRARRAQFFARSMVEHLGTLYQTVTEVLSLRAGSTHTQVEGTHHTQAKRATLLTRDEININGKSVNLG